MQQSERGRAEVLPTRQLRLRRLRKTLRSFCENVEAGRALQPKRERGTIAFVTLTYRDSAEPKPGDIRDFLQRARQWAIRRGFKLTYAWVMEMHLRRFERTGRAVPHFHCIIWLPPGFLLPKPDKQGWWIYGSTKVERARSVGYLLKYSSKGHTEGGPDYPQGARIYGVGGADAETMKFHRHCLKPAWVREFVGLGEEWHRIEGGAKNRVTGEWRENPFVCVPVRSGDLWALHVRPRCRPQRYFLPNGETNVFVHPEDYWSDRLWLKLRQYENEQNYQREALWEEAIEHAEEHAEFLQAAALCRTAGDAHGA